MVLTQKDPLGPSLSNANMPLIQNQNGPKVCLLHLSAQAHLPSKSQPAPHPPSSASSRRPDRRHTLLPSHPVGAAPARHRHGESLLRHAHPALRSSSSSTPSCPATRSSVGSTSSSAAAASKLPVAKVVAKCLVYDDDYFTLPSAAAPAPHHPDAVPEDGLATQDDDLAPLLELPDPDVVSAAADDALAASADSCVTEVPARAASTTDTEATAALPVPEEIGNAPVELRGARGLSPGSKRILTALAEAAALELAAPAATTTTARRAGFWGKVRVAILAVTLAAVAAADVALAAYLFYARRANERHGHALLPPT